MLNHEKKGRSASPIAHTYTIIEQLKIKCSNHGKARSGKKGSILELTNAITITNSRMICEEST